MQHAAASCHRFRSIYRLHVRKTGIAGLVGICAHGVRDQYSIVSFVKRSARFEGNLVWQHSYGAAEADKDLRCLFRRVSVKRTR